MATTEELFEAAVNVIRGLPKHGSYQPSHQLMLRFYGFYKQATEGPCQQAKPSFWDVIGKAKWEAWKKLGNMTKEEAMTSYVEELKKIVETMAYTDNVEKFMDVIGPFYEMIDFGDKGSEPLLNYNGHIHDNGDEIVEEINGSSLSFKGNASLSNGDVYNHERNELYERIEENNSYNEQVGMISKENLMEKYYSDSDSENDEFSDPIEIQTDELKILKKPLVDHNDNDSGFADQVENALRQAENGQNHVLFEDKYDQLWVVPNGSMIYGAISYKENCENEFTENGEADVMIGEDGRNQINVKGVMARGGGDEDNAAAGSSNPRQGTPSQEGHGRSQQGVMGQQDVSSSTRRNLLSGLGNNGRGGPGGGILQRQTTDINEQIAMALLRLQRDMDSVLARLNVLETVALAQHNSAQERLASHYNTGSQLHSRSSGPFWWPFKDISFRTFLIFMMWPIILQIILKILANRRARKYLRKC